MSNSRNVSLLYGRCSLQYFYSRITFHFLLSLRIISNLFHAGASEKSYRAIAAYICASSPVYQ